MTFGVITRFWGTQGLWRLSHVPPSRCPENPQSPKIRTLPGSRSGHCWAYSPQGASWGALNPPAGGLGGERACGPRGSLVLPAWILPRLPWAGPRQADQKLVWTSVGAQGRWSSGLNTVTSRGSLGNFKTRIRLWGVRRAAARAGGPTPPRGHIPQGSQGCPLQNTPRLGATSAGMHPWLLSKFLPHITGNSSSPRRVWHSWGADVPPHRD